MCPNFGLSVTRHFGCFGIGEEIVHNGHTTIPEIHARIVESTNGEGLSKDIVVYLLIGNFGTVDVVDHIVAARNGAEIIERSSRGTSCPRAIAQRAPTFPREVIVGNVGSCI